MMAARAIFSITSQNSIVSFLTSAIAATQDGLVIGSRVR